MNQASTGTGRLRRAWTASIVATAVACSGGGQGDEPDAAVQADAAGGADATPADAGASDATPRIITGVMNRRFVTPTGVEEVPVDLTGVGIVALAPPGFAAYPGAGLADGTFSIAGVPPGTLYIGLDQAYVVTDRDTIDFSFDVLGRPDGTAATLPTTLTFDVSNLQPWQPDDELQMFSPAGPVAFAMQSTADAGAPSVGATSLSGLVFDLANAQPSNLIDGGAGDTLTLAQLATASDGAWSYQALSRMFTPTPFTVADGGNADISGAFSTVAQSSTFAFTWDRGAFDDALRAHVPADSGPYAHQSLVVHTLPEAATRGAYHGSADLLAFVPGYVTDTSTVTGSWNHADLYPAAWTRMVSARYFTYRFVQLAGATAMATFSALYSEVARSTVSPAAPIVPQLGPVVDVQIDGLDAFTPLTGVGTTPTISWTAPTIGAPSHYYVQVTRLLDDGGATTGVGEAAFQTTATSLQIPPGLLVAGNTYVFYVIARSSPTLDLDATPYLLSLPRFGSQVATFPIQP